MRDVDAKPERRWWREVIVWLLLGASLVPLALPYLAPGIQYGHDREIAFIRIFALREAYLHLDLPPRWFGLFDGGYGSPYPSFYGMLFYHAAAWLALVGVPIARCVEICAALTFAGSAAGMFILCRRLWGDAAGLTGAVAYNYAPYHLLDAYQRGAYSELTSFVWMPLVLLGIHQWLCLRSARSCALAVGALTCLLLTHNLFPLMFLPPACLVLLAEVPHGRDAIKSIANRLTGMLWIFVLAGMVSAFFLLPVALERKYVHMDYFLQVDYRLHFKDWPELLGVLSTPGMIFEAGQPQFLLAGLAAAATAGLLLARRGPRHPATIVVSFTVAAAAVYMASRDSAPLWAAFPGLSIIQFPWRWLGIGAVFLAIACAGGVGLFKTLPGQWIACGVVCAATVFAQYPLASIDKRIDWIEIGEAEARDSILLGQDYRPVWSRTAFENVDDQNPRKAPPLPVQYADLPQSEPDVSIARQERKLNDWTIAYDSPRASVVTLPQFYYPGWEASIGGEAVEIHPVAPHGLLGLEVPAGAHEVRVRYGGTTAQRAGDWLTVVGLAAWLLTMLALRRKKSGQNVKLEPGFDRESR